MKNNQHEMIFGEEYSSWVICNEIRISLMYNSELTHLGLSVISDVSLQTLSLCKRVW